jgi:hypothetical protein
MQIYISTKHKLSKELINMNLRKIEPDDFASFQFEIENSRSFDD